MNQLFNPPSSREDPAGTREKEAEKKEEGSEKAAREPEEPDERDGVDSVLWEGLQDVLTNKTSCRSVASLRDYCDNVGAVNMRELTGWKRAIKQLEPSTNEVPHK